MKTKIKIVEPTKIIRPFDNVEVRLFGRNGGKTDWSIKPLVLENVLKARVLPPVYILVDRVAREAGIKTLYAPRPSEFNAQICASPDLREEIKSEAPVPILTQEFSDYESMMDDSEYKEWAEREGVSIHRGVNADGCDVPKGSAFWLSSADCPVLIVTDGRRVICTHCGYKSLVDRGALRGTPTRPYFSVVGAVLKEFIGRNRVNLRAFVTLGIGPHWSEASKTELGALAFYERLGCYPRESYRVGRKKLNIVELVRCQCLNRGIGNVRTDDNDTFADKDKDGKFLWWSYERAMKKSPADKLKRNGVMVVHN